MENKEIIEGNADEYLTSIGFNLDDLPVLFNNDDKSHYTISELMESYLQYKSLITIQTK